MQDYLRIMAFMMGQSEAYKSIVKAPPLRSGRNLENLPNNNFAIGYTIW